MSTLYHASFNGLHPKASFDTPLSRIKVVLAADSIYAAMDRVKEYYDFVTGICVTNMEATGREIFELRP